ncbi:MAG: glutamate 5-kinase [Candidatus Bathyarchaeia archaeon]
MKLITLDREYLKSVKRVVVKSGTSNLTNEQSRLDSSRVKNFVEQLMALKKLGKDVIVVTSGAIGAGIGRMNLPHRPSEISKLQAAAAIGQGILMQTYEHYFEKYKQPIAQILLTKDDFTNSHRYENLKHTLETLIGWGVIPIINENDTVAVDEIKVGDNDTLAAYVSIGVGAELLIILTDVDGLYTENPSESKGGQLIKLVEEVTPEVESLASRAGKGFGGMYTKVQAAKKLSEAGIATVIVNGSKRGILCSVIRGEDVGTLFLPKRCKT